MSGTVHTIRPNEEGINNAGGYSAVSSPVPGSLAAACADDSDSSYIVGTGTGTVVLGFGSYTLAATERVLRARVRFRAIGPSLGTHAVTVSFAYGNYTDGSWIGDESATVGAGPSSFTGGWHNGWPGGAEITQTALNKIQTKFHSTTFSGGTAVIFEQYLDAEVVTKPSVTASAPTGTNPGATHRPTVTWTPTIGDGYAQKKYQIKVFDKATNVSPVWANTLGLTWDSGVRAGTATSKVIDHTLRNSDYRVLVRVAKDFNGDDWWSDVATIDFTINDNPPVPTSLGPTGTILTGFPNLQARVNTSAFAYSVGVYAEWQLATDTGFTTNVRNINELSNQQISIFTNLVVIGGQAGNGAGVRYKQTDGVPFDQTVWYFRARTHDYTGGVSAWSTTATFTVAHAASAVAVAPLDGEYITTSVQIFQWQFVAWAPEETQTAYQILVTLPGGATVLDTGKVASTDQFAVTYITTEQDAIWQVRVWDDSDVVSFYSDPVAFHMVTLPTVGFVDPVNGSTIVSETPTISWTYSSPVARAQATWQLTVRDLDLQQIIYDTGITFGTDTSFVLPAVLTSGGHYSFAIAVTDTLGSPADALTDNVTVTFPPPAAPTNLASDQVTIVNRPILSGALAVPDIEVAQLGWDQTTIGDRFAYYEVQRFDTSDWVTIAQVTNEETPYWFDLECRRSVAGFANDYQVRVVDTIDGPSDWVTFPAVTIRTRYDTDLVFSSNWTPDLTVAYQDQPVYQFGTDDQAGVKTARMYGNPLPSVFRAPDRIGDQFGRTLIVAAHDPQIGGVDSGRVVYEPLLERVRDTFSPYVCVTDGMGQRWLCSLTFVRGTYQKTVESYLADVNFVEVAQVPVPAVTSSPWTASVVATSGYGSYSEGYQ